MTQENKQNEARILVKETYFAMIQNSVGTKMFRNLYVSRQNNSPKSSASGSDILKNGRLSCAVFVSSVLYLNKLITGPHATVSSTVKDMDNSGWQKVKKPKAGDILVWESYKWPGDKEAHGHIGFYVGGGWAISNSCKKSAPQKHHFTYGTKNGKPVRKITAIYRHRALNSKKNQHHH